MTAAPEAQDPRDEAIRLARRAGVALTDSRTDHHWIMSDDVLVRLIALARNPEMLKAMGEVRCIADTIAEAYRAAIRAAPPAPPEAMRDAQRWRMLPAFLEEFQINYVGLIRAIDAAIAQQEGEHD